MQQNRSLWLFIAPLAYAPLTLAGSAVTEPAAPVPTVTYQSAFETYRPFQEQPIADWRTLNEEVGRVGGHIGIFGGAAGHGGHGAPGASSGEPGQPPMRSAPKAPGVELHKH